MGDTIGTDRVQSLFAVDIKRSVDAARRVIPDLDKRPMEFQRGVANMMFQMGANADKKFPKAFAHLKAGNVEDGLRELGLNNSGDGPSLWAQQTPSRFNKVTHMIRSSIGLPSGGGGPDAPKPEVRTGPSQQELWRRIADNIPESWMERRGDEMPADR